MYEHQVFYPLLFEQGTDPVIVIKNNQIIDCNAATIALLAYPNKKALLMLTPADISPPFQPDGSCSKEKTADLIAKTLISGFECFDWTHQRADGELILIQAMFTVMVLNNETTIYVVWRNIRELQAKVAAPLSYDDLVLFDFENILSLLGNNQTLLAEILQEFKDGMQSFLTDLNDLLLAQDRLAAMALVHDLKGTAGNMGAIRLHAAVTDLDAVLKVRLPNQASVQNFSQTFVATMASLDNLLNLPR